jgi:hypothetical protein
MAYFTQNSDDNIAAADGVTASGAGKFPNPFCDIASMYMPTNLTDSFWWMEYLIQTQAPFMSVINRVVSYFLTEINVEGASDDVIDKYEEVLEKKLHATAILQEIGKDYFCYGNSFISLYLPFDRYLACPHCGAQAHIQAVSYKFEAKDCTFHGECKKCGEEVEFEIVDRPYKNKGDKVKVIRWNPKRMHIVVNPVSGRTKYMYDLEEELVRHVQDGDRFFLEDTPLEILKTACGSGNKREASKHRFMFDDNAIFHMRDATLAGLPVHGWGIPPLLPYFKLAYYIQLMRRYDEAIAMDFIVPFRILYPEGQAPGQDALTMVSMQSFAAAMQEMARKKRLNMTSLEVSPFPIGYQLLGGEAKQLAPKESIQEAWTELLASLGIPQDLFAGSLTLQAAPVALRLFERQFNVLVDNFNSILDYMVDKLSVFFGWEEVDAALSPITLADDLEQKGMQLQAAAGMDVSKSTAYRALGIDYIGEQRRMIEEQKKVQQLQTEAMLDQQAETENGEGNAPGAGNNPATTPGDMYSAAQDMTQQLLGMTHIQRRQYLAKVKQTNPTMHALLLQMLQEARQGMASQGREMIMQQNGMPS